MSYFFIDASHSLTIGKLSSKWEWTDYVQTEELPSVSLHRTVHQLSSENNWADVKGFIFCKGPGSYTGLRLLEGFEQYLRFENINCYDFYSFEIREILGLKDAFLYSAFKKQYLLCESENKLINSEDLDSNKNYYGDNLQGKIESKSILSLIKDNPEKIFPKILENKEKEIYYFRPLSEEFKK